MSKRNNRLTAEIVENLDKIRETGVHKIIVSCPWCDGTGYDGHDRSIPPDPYSCEVCDGKKEVEIRRID